MSGLSSISGAGAAPTPRRRVAAATRSKSAHSARMSGANAARLMRGARRFFAIVVGATLALGASGLTADPWGALSWYVHADLKSWTHTPIIFTPIEISLMVLAAMWLFRNVRARRAFTFQRGSLFVPLLVFVGCLALGVLNGQLQGVSLNIALWEVRGFLMLLAVYLLACAMVHTDDDLNRLVWAVLIAATVLSVENLIRWLVFLHGTAQNDLAYDHTDSVVLIFALVLCLSLLFFGGTRAQQRYALPLIPVIFFCTLVMERRAAFAVLLVAIVVLVIFLLRLRPRLFWQIVPPLVLISGLYLVVFWHNTGAFGQPARAISSMISPDPRDASSNLYRDIEKLDITLNIQSAPITGLGFGRPFTFYAQLPDLSFWPFWHYTTHNAVLWVWMKDGVLGFIAFWWLLGRGAYDGSKVVETQREEWHLVGRLRAQLTRLQRRGDTGAAPEWRKAAELAHVVLRPAGAPVVATRRLPPERRGMGFNVPNWERTNHIRTVTARRSGALALLVAGICLIPAQVTYSYVDLGLTSDRTMLLLGLVLGILARGPTLMGVAPTDGAKSKGSATMKPKSRGSAPRRVSHSERFTTTEAQEIVRYLIAPTSRSRPFTQAGEQQPAAPQAETQETQVLSAPLIEMQETQVLPTASKAHDEWAEEQATVRLPVSPALSRSLRRDDEPLPWER